MQTKLQIQSKGDAVAAYEAAIAEREDKRAVWESFPADRMEDRKLWAKSSDAKHKMMADKRSFHPGQAPWTPMMILYTMVKNYIKLNVDPKNLVKSQLELFQWSPDGAHYATLICLALDQPFKELESVISSDAEHSYIFAKFVLKGPFAAAEKTIAKDEFYSMRYQSFLGSGVSCEA